MQPNEYKRECPRCHSVTQSGKTKPKFYVNEAKGVGFCHHCSFSCSLEDLNKEFEVEQAQESQEVDLHKTVDLKQLAADLESSPDALSYLKSRFGLAAANALDQDVLSLAGRFQLGFDRARAAIAIPSFLEGSLRCVKYRQLSDTSDLRYISETGSKNGLFIANQDLSFQKVFICEGEFDAMSAAVLGFEGPVIALQTNRISNAARLTLKGLLKDTKSLYVCPDSDTAGMQMFADLSQLLGEERLIRFEIPTPYKDLNEVLAAEGQEKAKAFFAGLFATLQPKVAQETALFSTNLTDTLEFLLNADNMRGFSSGIPLLDFRLGGGFRPHELTLINAEAKVGKTTFCLQLIHTLVEASRKVGFISLEMDPNTFIKPSLMSIALKRDMRAQKDPEKITALFAECLEKASYLDNLHFFMRYGSTPAQDICDWVKYIYEEKGVDHIFLDHIGYSLRDQMDISEHSKLAKALKTLTIKYPIHFYAIAQPPKLGMDKQGNKQRVSKDTLFGGSVWGQTLDNLITLERVKDKENELAVRLAESRFPSSRPSMDEYILMVYDRETCSLSC